MFLDGIQRTVDDSEGSKYALDGSYYVSPEAGTYFELSEDGNTIVGADGTEYVKSEEKSKDVNGVEYTTYEEQVYSETPFAGTFWSLLPPIVAIVLALISKEVYSSLFLGCLVGALLVSNFQPWETLVQLVEGDNGIVTVVAGQQQGGALDGSFHTLLLCKEPRPMGAGLFRRIRLGQELKRLCASSGL